MLHRPTLNEFKLMNVLLLRHKLIIAATPILYATYMQC